MRELFIGVCAVIGYAVIIALIMALPIWILWNWLMPVIFQLPTINIAQALGLSLLSGCLFGWRNKSKKNEDNKTW